MVELYCEVTIGYIPRYELRAGIGGEAAVVRGLREGKGGGVSSVPVQKQMAVAALLLLLPMMLLPLSLSGNPLVPDSGMADANIKFFDGSWLVFATHDYAPNNTHFLMRDWQVWLGLGRIVALYHRSSTLYHIRYHIRYLYF